MARPKLRALPGGRCPDSLRPSVVRDIDRELKEIGLRLSRLADAARVDLQNEDAFGEILTAAGSLQLARVHLAHGREI